MKINQTEQNCLAAAGLVAARKMPDDSAESIRVFESQHPNLWAKAVAGTTRKLQARNSCTSITC